MAFIFRDDFKRFFSRGLAAVLPTLLTISIFVYLFTRLNDYVGKYINIGLVWLFEKIDPSLDADFGARWLRYYWWVGFLLAIVAIYIFGRFVGSFIGRSIWRRAEAGFGKVPLVKQVYPSIKQVTDFLLSERRIDFSRVVAIEYPRRGIWSLGLVTGPGMRGVSERVDQPMLSVFIPSSPTPFTGYTILVPRDEVIDLPISIDEALRFTISGGVVLPGSQQLAAPQGEVLTAAVPLAQAEGDEA